MESAWRSPAPPWAREKRERRRAEPDAAAAGLCGALALWELAERALVGPAFSVRVVEKMAEASAVLKERSAGR